MADDTIVIRSAVREDMQTIMKMIIDLATFEGCQDEVEISATDLERDAFDTDPPSFFCIVAEEVASKTIVGYALCNFAYSSWVGRAMYLEDIYVIPSVRGKKVGHMIFKEMCKIARDNKCHRIDWHTLKDNATAIKFYESHGAFDLGKKENRTSYRIYYDGILKMANESV